MAIRTTVDIPEPLHDRLRQRSQRTGVSIRALVVRALKTVYGEKNRGEYVSGPLIAGKGKLGPAFPEDENPHDHAFS